MKENGKTGIVEENGVVYRWEKSRAFSDFCRVAGVVLMVLGALLALALPPVGILFVVLGALFFFKISKHRKKVLVSMPMVLAGRSTFGEWNEKVHRGAAQSDRFERARHECMALTGYNSGTGVATVDSSSGKTYTTTLDYCSCEDFQKRSKPCKHIYFLATQMGYTSEDFYNA